jgi:hypothetical protein
MLKASFIIEIIGLQQGNFMLKGMDNGNQGVWFYRDQRNVS